MKKYDTIKENRDFRRIYGRGKSFVSPVLVTYVIKNRGGSLRYGITTGKKIGKAVQRNRARRVIRAAFFDVADNIASGYDVVFVARGKTPHVKSTRVLSEMKNQLKKAGIYDNDIVSAERQL